MDTSLLVSGLSSLMGHKIYSQEEANSIVSEYGNQITIEKVSLEAIYTKSLQAASIGEVKNLNVANSEKSFSSSFIKINIHRTATRLDLSYCHDESFMVNKDSTIAEFKTRLEQINWLASRFYYFTFQGKRLDESKTFNEIGISDGATIQLICRILGGAHIINVFDPSILDPNYDCDFTDTKDTTKFIRGGKEYIRPCGWKRYALNVQYKYESGNIEWLGDIDGPNEWCVTYHGTSKASGENIVNTKYNISVIGKFKSGIYTSPKPEYAEKYTNDKTFTHNNIKYKFMIQNRIKPGSFTIGEEPDEDEWICKDATCIRPYGFLIKNF